MLLPLTGCSGRPDVPVAPPAPTPTPAAFARVSLEVLAVGGSGHEPIEATVRSGVTGTRTLPAIVGQTLAIDVPVGDSLDITISESPAGALTPASGRATVAHDTTIDVVLLPSSWTIARGIYAGSTVPIDLGRAFGADSDDTRYLDHWSPSGRLVFAWAASAFPITVARDTTAGALSWTADDSAFFWHAASDFNTVAGEELFRPGDAGAALRPNGISVRIMPLSIAGLTNFATFSSECHEPRRVCTDLSFSVELNPGVFLIGPPSGLFYEYHVSSSLHTMEHELMHALGFGHACYWPSVLMRTGPRCAPVTDMPTRPTASDIAYIEMMTALATVLQAHPFAWSIAEALTPQ